MASVSIEFLKKQLESVKTEFEQVKTQLYRCDGAVQMLTQLVAAAEKELVTPDEVDKG